MTVRVALSRYSYQPMPVSEENLLLMRILDEQYTQTPFYGIKKMTACLVGHTRPGGQSHARGPTVEANEFDGGVSQTTVEPVQRAGRAVSVCVARADD